MTYTIPSQTVRPGSAYQPKGIAPAYVKQNARALYLARPGAYNSTRLLDQSPLNSGTRRTGSSGGGVKGDGTDDEIIFGDFGAAIWFSGWVRLDSDNQCLFSLSNSTATALSVTAGVLTAGATLTLTGIKIDNVSKTASEAGALLNDNAWHFLSCGIGDGLGGASTADDVRYFTDGTAHGAVTAFDWRFYSTAPTADELTEAYSGDSPNRNAAELSKYAAWTPLEEQDGTTAYGISGNGITGTLTNMTLANARISQDIYSFQNQVGYNKRMYFDGSSTAVILSTGDFQSGDSSGKITFKYIPVRLGSTENLIAKSDESTNTNYWAIRKNTSNKIDIGIVETTTQLVLSANTTTLEIGTEYVIEIESDGAALSITINGVTQALSASTGSNTGQWLDSISGADNFVAGALIRNSPVYSQGVISDVIYYDGLGNIILDCKGYGNTDADWIDTSGNGNNGTVIGSPSNIYIPRDESNPSNDVLGNPLTYTGRRPNDGALINSNCLTADGTLYIAAAHLTGTETVVSSEGTSTPSISAGRIDFTAGTCWNLLLSDGTHYKLAHGYGTIIADSSGDGNHGTLANATLASAWGATQNDYHSNLLDGCGKRMWFDGLSSYISVTGMTNLNNYFQSCTISATYYTDVVVGNNVVLWALGGVAYRLYISMAGVFYINQTDTGIAAPAGENIVSVIYDTSGNGVSLSLNGVEVWTGIATQGPAGSTFYIGARSADLNWKGLIYDFELSGSSVKNFAFDGYGNTDTDWIDTTGNGNNGTVVGAPEPYYIPAAQNGLDAFGQPLTDPFIDGKRNRAETEYAYNPDSTPEMGADQLWITVPADHAFGDAYAASTQIFSRQRTETEDRTVVMPETQTGDALTTLQNYTAS